MQDENDNVLLEPAELDRVIETASFKLSQLVRTSSRYHNLSALASLHQQLGNDLSKLIYEKTSNRRRIACASGCATCCLIPSAVRRDNANNFTLSVLDIVTLIEHYPAIKDAVPSLLGKATASVQRARASNDVAPCPYLGDRGTCGVYEQRPVSCKIWFSSDLQLCIRNKAVGYQSGINPITDASNKLRMSFEAPFKDHVAEITPDLDFGGYDYLQAFEAIALLDSHGLIATLKEKVDAGEFADWDPLGPAVPA